MYSPEYIGFFAAILTTAAFLPQAFKIWKSKNADGLSLTMYATMGLGILSWLIYGIMIESPSVIAANSLSFSITVFISIFIIRYRK